MRLTPGHDFRLPAVPHSLRLGFARLHFCGGVCVGNRGVLVLFEVINQHVCNRVTGIALSLPLSGLLSALSVGSAPLVSSGPPTSKPGLSATAAMGGAMRPTFFLGMRTSSRYLEQSKGRVAVTCMRIGTAGRCKNAKVLSDCCLSGPPVLWGNVGR